MSDAQDDSQKTEEPTSKKLADARKKGQIAQSKEVSNFATLLGMTFMVALLAPFIAFQLHTSMARVFHQAALVHLDAGSAGEIMFDLTLDALLALSPAFGLFMVLALLASIGQSGLLFTTEPITPKLEKLSPISGLKRMFSLKSVVEFLKGIVKMSIVGAIAYMLVSPELDRAEQLLDMDLIDVLAEIQTLVIKLMIGVLGFMFVVAVADFVYQRYEFMKQMRMSRQEIRDEHKQSDGDPQVKARLRQIRMDRARRRMMSAVPQADVVVTNPTHFAVALKYDTETMAAPTLVAKGADAVALRIREVANEHKVPIVENPPLARALFAAVEIDQQIPETHYKAVAQVISYVYRLKGRKMTG
ncbi:MAG: flagellar biosynthesis protein FlhB [Thalassobaculum sp.]|uniref:flagellar biosynthesis protein FlhB n=1 Tax=Thalassobaculum sp. TaxID=2022740 RepID=UPI0032EDA2AF